MLTRTTGYTTTNAGRPGFSRSARGLIRRGTRPGRPAVHERAQGPVTLTPSSPDPEADPAGGGGHKAPGTHRPEVGLFVGAHAAASNEQRRQAAGPAAAPAPQQQAAVRHGCRRNPHGPGALRRRGSAAADGQRPVAPACGGPLGTERAQDSVVGPPLPGKPTPPTRAFPDPGALTSAVRRALGAGRSGRSATSLNRSWRWSLRRRA